MSVAVREGNFAVLNQINAIKIMKTTTFRPIRPAVVRALGLMSVYAIGIFIVYLQLRSIL